MIEPLFWNPLPDAAAWLTQKTGRRMDVRTLVDTVAQMGEEGNPAPTIIKAMLPKGLNFASLAIGKPAPQPESDTENFLRERLAKLFGPLPVGVSYLRVEYPTTSPLCVNNLLELLMHGEFSTGLILNKSPSDGHMVWLMPWGTEYNVTLETCGINRADLLALGDKLIPPAQNTATPAPVEQAKAKRRTWWDVTSPYIVEIMQAGQYATAKELYNALEAKAGLNSPFDKGTGNNRFDLFVRELAMPLSMKTVQNNWQKLRDSAAQK